MDERVEVLHSQIDFVGLRFANPTYKILHAKMKKLFGKSNETMQRVRK